MLHKRFFIIFIRILFFVLFLPYNKVWAQTFSIFENIAIGKQVTSNVDNLSLLEPAKALNGTVNDVAVATSP
ncbi:hypothetical protein EZS27_032627 [termite gut metagenome]|uniref:Uncharacterized protein n=1 Tax=termite gut metagenome TaxID=433724 RepID=A0A5J4Q6A5_9ZZZZ